MTDTQRPHNGGERGASLEAQRQYFTLWLEQLERVEQERNLRYDERQARVDQRLDDLIETLRREIEASDRRVGSAFDAAQKAGDKAEQAIEKHFELTNNYQATAREQAREMATKPYVDGKLETVVDRIDLAYQEIAALRESRSQTEGRQVQTLETRQSSQWSIGLLVGSLIGGFGIIVAIVGVAIALLQK